MRSEWQCPSWLPAPPVLRCKERRSRRNGHAPRMSGHGRSPVGLVWFIERTRRFVLVHVRSSRPIPEDHDSGIAPSLSASSHSCISVSGGGTNPRHFPKVSPVRHRVLPCGHGGPGRCGKCAYVCGFALGRHDGASQFSSSPVCANWSGTRRRRARRGPVRRTLLCECRETGWAWDRHSRRFLARRRSSGVGCSSRSLPVCSI